MPPSGKEIYRTTDDLGPIQVFDDGEMRYLSFGEDDEQSCVLKAQPQVPQYDYIRAMLLPLLYRRPRDALLLGMGGGALATFLYRHYPSITLRAVELRPAVIEIAHAFSICHATHACKPLRRTPAILCAHRGWSRPICCWSISTTPTAWTSVISSRGLSTSAPNW